MADEILKRDSNHVTVLGAITDNEAQEIRMIKVDPTTGRVLASITGAGTGSVTDVSVVSANGFAGTVATSTTTPAITLTTSITGILKGNGTAISAVTIGSGLSFDGTTLSATGGGITIGSSTITGGTTTRVLYDNAGVVGEYTISGSGTVVAMATSPDLTTPDINVATADSLQAGTASSGLLMKNNDGVTVASFGVGSASSTNIALSGNTALGANNLTMTGSIAATGARVTKGWFTDIESTNMPTVGGTSLSSTFLGLAGGTMIGDITLGENTSIALDPAGSADGKYTGITVTGTAGTTLAFGDLVYLAAADSRWELADADASATAGPVMMGMCVLAAAADGNATKILLQGIIRADSKFPALTIGAPAYVGETAGAIQTAIPTGADNVIRVVGFAMTADELYFNPSQDHQITVA